MNVGFVNESSNGEASDSSVSARKVDIAKSKFLELQGPILSDIYSMNRLIPNKVGIRIRLEKHASTFSILSPTAKAAEVKIEFDDIFVRMYKVGISPVVYKSISNTLDQGDSFFPYTRTVVKAVTIAKGSFGVTFDRIHSGKLPRIAIVGIVDAEAFRGELQKSPFNFQHCNVSKILMTPDDGSTPANWQLFDFAKDKVLDGYTSLCDAIGNTKETVINRKTFVNGKTLFGFQLYPTIDNIAFAQQKTGSVKLEIGLSKETDKAYVGIVYMIFDARMHMSKNREFYVE